MSVTGAIWPEASWAVTLIVTWGGVVVFPGLHVKEQAEIVIVFGVKLAEDEAMELGRLLLFTPTQEKVTELSFWSTKVMLPEEPPVHVLVIDCAPRSWRSISPIAKSKLFLTFVIASAF